ncbi:MULTISPECIES: GspH/FimT family pseudopilin [Marinobacter]|uniref:Type II secretion system protein H n=1 Tax=Marinobacter profundi TaxID=2666256 RepID=A0A2G1UHG3_9GAMM|nr:MULTISPECIES: GspH/FimT family pseudopilin [Marinobacter]MBD3657662.1 GspH/FimT family pseudopilin [Marinobacter sp.]PHQ13924.1 hypothetical protein CLH61_15350 [Marinobacter profundi]
MTLKPAKGFTLIELIVTIAVLAIVVGWAVPSMVTMINQNRLTATSNQMLGLLNQARSEALRRADRVWVSPLTGTAWSSGAVVWRDANGDGARSDAEIIRMMEGNSGLVSVSGSASSLATAPFGFDGAGFAIEEQAYSLTLCADGLSNGQLIEINGGGQIRTSAANCGGGG